MSGPVWETLPKEWDGYPPIIDGYPERWLWFLSPHQNSGRPFVANWEATPGAATQTWRPSNDPATAYSPAMVLEQNWIILATFREVIDSDFSEDDPTNVEGIAMQVAIAAGRVRRLAEVIGN